jgi:riboflavin-specific deaminase-like protein
VPATDADRPAVTIHYAQTLDGRIATRTGHSQWISGEASLRLAHELRASHQAVLVGVGTILADNPRLTVRLAAGRSPRRIVVDSTLRLPLDAHVLTDGAAETLLATTARAPEGRLRTVRRCGAEVLVVGQDRAGCVDLGDLLRRLARLGVSSVLLEGGRGLITSALRERLVDRLVVCIAPKVIGSGIEAVGDLDIRRLGEALTFARASFTALGQDVIFDGYLESCRVPEGGAQRPGLGTGAGDR